MANIIKNEGPNRPEAAPVITQAGLSTLAVIFFVIAALYFGREIFVPIALAVLLSFALGPLVSWLRRLRVPRIPSVITVVLLAFLAIFAFGAIVTMQVAQLAQDLPTYQRNIQTKIRALKGAEDGEGVVERASTMIKELSDEIAETEEEEEAGESASPVAPDEPVEEEEVEPVPVEIQEPDPEPLQVLQSLIGPLIAPLATGGIVIVFVIFMLLQREDLRDRFIRLAGGHDLQRTTRAIGDAGRRVGHYLLMQLVVNVTYGIPIGIGLWLIGVPNPLLWGMLTIVLRFVPYIGPIIAAAFPLALSVAVDPGWSMLLWTAALFIVIELISNNFVEPWLYGSSTGLSPVAIIIAAIFWTWLWGPVGLLLSTPLTVCLVVLGTHVPQFTFLNVLFGSEPVLTPPESLYQRLLAGDPDEATERAEEFLEEKTLLAFYDEVAIPALALADHDRARGALEDERRAVVAAGIATLADNLAEHEDVAPDEEEEALNAAPPQEPAPPWRERSAVLCAGGRNNLDDAAADMLSHVLERRGFGTRAVPCEAMADLGRLDLESVRMVCLSYMNAQSMAHARYLVRRLRRRLPDTPILVSFWTLGPEEAERRNPLSATKADFSATTLEEAVGFVLDAAMKRPGDAASQPPSSSERRSA